MSQPSSDKYDRRAFLKGSGAIAASALATSSVAGAETAAPPAEIVSGSTTITLKVNGKQHSLEVEPRTTLLDVLRYQLDLTGAKPVSTDGVSGASTVLIDGKPAMASTILAVSVDNKAVETIEGLGGDEPHAIVRAFVNNDAQQCGFCTPGFVMTVRAFLNKNTQATEEEIRGGLNGNICRCGTYANVMRAALEVVKGGSK